MPAIATLCCLLLVCASTVHGASADSVRAEFKRPLVTVPLIRQPPVIDGAIGEEEWRDATSIQALLTTRQEVSRRQTRYWMAWDADHLYLAMRSPLRPGERVVQAIRRRDRDRNVVFDDSYEVWLDVGSHDPDTGLVCFFQFLANYAGARLDTLHLPSVGNSRLTWSSGWAPQNRITPDGSAWEWEMVIPRESVFRDEPFHHGFELSCLLARNYKRPWEQNSIEGTSSFAVLDTHSRLRLSADAPALHLLDVRAPDGEHFGLHLMAHDEEEGAVTWRFASDGGETAGDTLAWSAGGLATTGARLDLTPAGEGFFRVTVADDDGQTLLDWCGRRRSGEGGDPRQVMDDADDVVTVSPSFNPVHDYVRVTGDFIDYDARDDITSVEVEVLDAEGGVLGSKQLTIDELAYVEGTIPLPGIANGSYRTRLTCVDADGEKVLTRESSFTKKDHAEAFDWWDTPRGDIERVIAPWTPVTLEDGRFGVWGREMTAGVAGLPAQVTAQGKPLLAAASSLVAGLDDGRELVAIGSAGDPEVGFDAEHRKVVTYHATLGTLAITGEVQVEFDGMYKVTLLLDPQQPQALENLRIRVPLRPQAAEYVHAAGEGIRTGFHYGFLPTNERGVLWTSERVDSQPMAVGSFIPYLWLGSTAGGLCWFADSDQGWIPSDQTPAIEVRRDGEASTDLVLNLISEPTTIDRPREIVFAFQASPVKPMHRKWRMDSWWCGDTFKNWSSTGHLIWSAIPYCRDVPKCKEMVEQAHASTNSYIFGIDTYRANAVPYFIHQSLPGHLVPEVEYFGDQWTTSISECLYYGKRLTDYMVHHYSEWCEQTGIDGYYVDNMRPVACDNIDAGRGYRLPYGRIQPTYQMFSTRRYFLRMRAAFAEHGKHDKIVLHMTNNMILPWVGAADIAYDGEHFVIYPEMGKDFMDFWSLERMRVDYPAQWGVAVNFMHEYQGRWDPVALLKAKRAYTGMVGLHDALPSGNANGGNQPFWIGRDRFGIEADDVAFTGYWAARDGVTCDQPGIHVSYWTRPGKVLLLVVNTGEATTAEVALDPEQLGLPAAAAGWQVVDAEAGTQMERRRRRPDGSHERIVAWSAAGEGEIGVDGPTLRVPVKRHDYRQVIVSER